MFVATKATASLVGSDPTSEASRAGFVSRQLLNPQCELLRPGSAVPETSRVSLGSCLRMTKTTALAGGLATRADRRHTHGGVLWIRLEMRCLVRCFCCSVRREPS